MPCSGNSGERAELFGPNSCHKANAPLNGQRSAKPWEPDARAPHEGATPSAMTDAGKRSKPITKRQLWRHLGQLAAMLVTESTGTHRPQ